ncbi:hypothetical protein BASA50_007418 [Batrachochytrium salamandrivorans]|uniref:DUF4460 domain-containing protein n=1 Tax=Batrachochytrium salamandrivorans TaxID=1357716 RepID=A0ABQ8F6Q5_9FUNG|nr:hypothetical protein BASA50_007418 [Batrachochytrium salamandrivorans]
MTVLRVTASALATASIRRYMPAFVRTIHPDYFSGQPEVRSMNQASLQTINAIVASLQNANERGRNASDVYSALHVVDVYQIVAADAADAAMSTGSTGSHVRTTSTTSTVRTTARLVHTVSAFAAPVRIHHCVVDDPVLIEEDQSEGWAQSTAAHTFHADHHSDKRSTTTTASGALPLRPTVVTPLLFRSLSDASQADLYRVLMARSLLDLFAKSGQSIWAKDFHSIEERICKVAGIRTNDNASSFRSSSIRSRLGLHTKERFGTILKAEISRTDAQLDLVWEKPLGHRLRRPDQPLREVDDTITTGTRTTTTGTTTTGTTGTTTTGTTGTTTTGTTGTTTTTTGTTTPIDSNDHANSDVVGNSCTPDSSDLVSKLAVLRKQYPFVFFHPSLGLNQRYMALSRLHQYRDAIQYHRWRCVPIMLHDLSAGVDGNTPGKDMWVHQSTEQDDLPAVVFVGWKVEPRVFGAYIESLDRVALKTG